MRIACPRFVIPAQNEANEKRARKSFIYRIYAECARNSFRIRFYEKHRGCGGYGFL
jgi:hypothetical protein